MTSPRETIATRLTALIDDVEAMTFGTLARSEIIKAVIEEANAADQAITDALLARWAAIEAAAH